jgi:hypothetical protein
MHFGEVLIAGHVAEVIEGLRYQAAVAGSEALFG